MSKDTFCLGGKEFTSRFILGSGKYSLDLIKAAVENAGAEIITLAVRRTNTKDTENILDYIPDNVTLLPNTSGARDAKEAVRIARMSRELGCGNFVKIEIMRDSKYLLPDNAETVKATEILAKEGIDIRVVDVHTIKPIDRETIIKCANETEKLISIEDHSVIGGLGTAIAEVLTEECPKKLVRMGMKDCFGKSGKAMELLEYFGLVANNIVEEVKKN